MKPQNKQQIIKIGLQHTQQMCIWSQWKNKCGTHIKTTKSYLWIPYYGNDIFRALQIYEPSDMCKEAVRFIIICGYKFFWVTTMSERIHLGLLGDTYFFRYRSFFEITSIYVHASWLIVCLACSSKPFLSHAIRLVVIIFSLALFVFY